MAGVRHKLLHFFRDNAIALASLSIAVMGLYLTITAQQEEREHKELLLRPALNLEVRPGTYSVSFFNHGLGPAQITDTIYVLDGQCHFMNRANSFEFAKTDFPKVERYFSNYFIRPFEALWKDGVKSPLKSPAVFGSAVPLPGMIVAVGQEFNIFKLEREIATEVYSTLHSSGLETRYAFDDEFVRHATSMPLSIRYCSMSEQYCALHGVQQYNQCNGVRL
jgi:hypothetical protein